MCSLIGGLTCPIVVAAGNLLWCKARLAWATGYVTGDPMKRYNESKRAFHIWTGFLIQLAASGATALHVAGLF